MKGFGHIFNSVEIHYWDVVVLIRMDSMISRFKSQRHAFSGIKSNNIAVNLEVSLSMPVVQV